MRNRDERIGHRTRSKESENFFNSNGLVETLDDPRDIYYKRDSIMHARHRKGGPVTSM